MRHEKANRREICQKVTMNISTCCKWNEDIDFLTSTFWVWFLYIKLHLNKSLLRRRQKLCRIPYHVIVSYCTKIKSTKAVIFQEINIHFSNFCRKFKYADILFSLNEQVNKWRSKNVSVQASVVRVRKPIRATSQKNIMSL